MNPGIFANNSLSANSMMSVPATGSMEEFKKRKKFFTAAKSPKFVSRKTLENTRFMLQNCFTTHSKLRQLYVSVKSDYGKNDYKTLDCLRFCGFFASQRFDFTMFFRRKRPPKRSFLLFFRCPGVFCTYLRRLFVLHPNSGDYVQIGEHMPFGDNRTAGNINFAD